MTTEELPNHVFEYLNSNLNLSLKQVIVLIKFEPIENRDILNEANTFFRDNTDFYSRKTLDNHLIIRLEKRKIRKIGYSSFEAAKDDIEKLLNKNFINYNFIIGNKFIYSCVQGVNNAFYESFLEKVSNSISVKFSIQRGTQFIQS